MRAKNQVRLKPAERRFLKQMMGKGREKARTITRCRILLLADEGKTDTGIIDYLQVARNTVRAVRARYVKGGLEAALSEQPRSGAPRKFTGRQKAKITALACSKPPEGQGRWTLRLLADTLVELDYVETISHQTVKRILKKTTFVPT